MFPKAHQDKINTAKNDRYRELVRPPAKAKRCLTWKESHDRSLCSAAVTHCSRQVADLDLTIKPLLTRLKAAGRVGVESPKTSPCLVRESGGHAAIKEAEGLNGCPSCKAIEARADGLKSLLAHKHAGCRHLKIECPFFVDRARQPCRRRNLREPGFHPSDFEFEPPPAPYKAAIKAALPRRIPGARLTRGVRLEIK